MLKENLEFESLTYKTLGNTKERKAVSYTHLTLPTIRWV